LKNLSFKTLEKAGQEAALAARESAKAADTFISYGRDGKVIREYPDGLKTEVKYDGSGNFTETPYLGK
jgi:hypothetical protein